MWFPPDVVTWSGVLAERFLPYAVLEESQLSLSHNHPGKAPSPHCLCAARGWKWWGVSTQEPKAHRLQLSPETPALLFFPWHSPLRPDPWDLEPVCITVGDALPWTRYKGSRQAVLGFKWELNWTPWQAVGITNLLLFVKEKKIMSNYGNLVS